MVTSMIGMYLEDDVHTDETFREFLNTRTAENGFSTVGDSRTKQSLREGTDINVLMKRWEQHGIPIPSPGREPVYGDFSDGRSYQECLTAVMEAGANFMELPAEVRKACDNDPGKFLDMCGNPERLEELRALGLVEQREPGFAEKMLKVLEERLPAAVESSEPA